MRTSVVICVYTEERWEDIRAAVASVRRQSRAPDELILVVDHNPDLHRRLTEEYPDALVIENAEERGLSGGKNTGTKIATGDIVAFLDDDAVAGPGGQRKVRSIIITGAGGRAFSAGTDLKQRRTLSLDEKARQSQALLALAEEIWALPKPVIAAVCGWCLGGGAELALACDFRIAGDDTTFGFPEMTLGAYPGSGGPVTLSRMVGATRAKDLLFTARRFGAAEALRIGMVERVAPAGQLLAAALEWAGAMEATAPLAIAALKRSINEGAVLPFRDANAFDQQLRRPLDTSKDNEEGMRAHFEKRPPVFRGE